MNYSIVVPWHDPVQKEQFLKAWGITLLPEFLILQQDPGWKSCAKTKNAGIRRAIDKGSEIIIVLDSDCYPRFQCLSTTLEEFAHHHTQSLNPQPVEIFKRVTIPSSRGTPYFSRTITMPVAASMGFWDGVPDFDAPGQLVNGVNTDLKLHQEPIFGQFFPLCGMNLAFRSEEWPWCQFVNVPRMDDIWSGFLWQKKAYSEGKCFNLNGPIVYHSRQSNVWSNLKIETENLERNETLWSEIATGPLLAYNEMLQRYGLTV